MPSTTATTAAPRLARAAVVSVLVLSFSVGAHLAGGGTMPDPLVLAALVSLTLAATTIAGRARFTPTRLVAVLGTAQLALHSAFDVLGHRAHLCADPLTDSAPHVQHAQMTTCAPITVSHGATPGWMVLAHLVATLTLAFALARGEDAIRCVLAWLGRRLMRDVAPAYRHEQHRPVRVARRVARPHGRPFSTAPTRGPPAAPELVAGSS